MKWEAENKIADDFKRVRKTLQFLKHEDYLDVVPNMPNKDKVYEFLAKHEVRAARVLINIYKLQSIDLMPIRNLRLIAQELCIDGWKDAPNEIIRKKVHDYYSSKVQQTSEQSVGGSEDESQESGTIGDNHTE